MACWCWRCRAALASSPVAGDRRRGRCDHLDAVGGAHRDRAGCPASSCRGAGSTSDTRRDGAIRAEGPSARTGRLPRGADHPSSGSGAGTRPARRACRGRRPRRHRWRRPDLRPNRTRRCAHPLTRSRSGLRARNVNSEGAVRPWRSPSLGRTARRCSSTTQPAARIVARAQASSTRMPVSASSRERGVMDRLDVVVGEHPHGLVRVLHRPEGHRLRRASGAPLMTGPPLRTHPV